MGGQLRRAAQRLASQALVPSVTARLVPIAYFALSFEGSYRYLPVPHSLVLLVLRVRDWNGDEQASTQQFGGGVSAPTR
jgi:hypothetical protein